MWKLTRVRKMKKQQAAQNVNVDEQISGNYYPSNKIPQENIHLGIICNALIIYSVV